MSAATERRVRVTLEGAAHSMADGNVLRVQYASDASALVVLDRGGVTVEDAEPERTWTTGDVVAGDGVYVREADNWWRGYLAGLLLVWSDDEITEAVDHPQDGKPFYVLRYQAGGTRG